MSANVKSIKRLKARFPGVCKGCDNRFPTGTEITWSREAGAWHDRCWDQREERDRSHNERDLVRGYDGQVLDWATAARFWIGDKRAQWALWAVANEHWDGEPEAVDWAAKAFHEQWEAGTWRRLWETTRGIEREGGWR